MGHEQNNKTHNKTHTHTHPYNSNNYRKKNLTEPKTNSSLKKAKTAKEKKRIVKKTHTQTQNTNTHTDTPT